MQEEAVRALCSGEGRTGANSGRAGFSFFTHHANKTEQNASVVVAESSKMWLDKDAERLGWLPGGQGPFGKWTKVDWRVMFSSEIEGKGLTSQPCTRGPHSSPVQCLESSPCLFYLVEITP